mmetsp:Transcript_22925/g.57959  ORF Transcript_22925/g.57959 Transcript_22925/m.57959 type:complete len:458 (+) Transcript_22925:253-1626(+)
MSTQMEIEAGGDLSFLEEQEQQLDAGSSAADSAEGDGEDEHTDTSPTVGSHQGDDKVAVATSVPHLHHSPPSSTRKSKADRVKKGSFEQTAVVVSSGLTQQQLQAAHRVETEEGRRYYPDFVAATGNDYRSLTERLYVDVKNYDVLYDINHHEHHTVVVDEVKYREVQDDDIRDADGVSRDIYHRIFGYWNDYHDHFPWDVRRKITQSMLAKYHHYDRHGETHVIHVAPPDLRTYSSDTAVLRLATAYRNIFRELARTLRRRRSRWSSSWGRLQTPATLRLQPLSAGGYGNFAGNYRESLAAMTVRAVYIAWVRLESHYRARLADRNIARFEMCIQAGGRWGSNYAQYQVYRRRFEEAWNGGGETTGAEEALNGDLGIDQGLQEITYTSSYNADGSQRSSRSNRLFIWLMVGGLILLCLCCVGGLAYWLGWVGMTANPARTTVATPRRSRQPLIGMR